MVLVGITRDIGYCNVTAEVIYRSVTGRSPDCNEQICPYEELIDGISVMTPNIHDYTNLVTNNIDSELARVGIVLINLRNSSGEESLWCHTFIISLVGNDVYRIESYKDEYTTRMAKWPEWREDIRLLLETPVCDRLIHWNRIFGVNEVDDEDYGPIDVTITPM